MMALQNLLDGLHATSLFCSDIRLTATESGAVNKSYALYSGNDKYFVKVFDPYPLTMERRRQVFKQQQVLAKIGIAPAPMLLEETLGFQVDHWIDFTPLAHQGCSLSDKIQVTAKALATIHQMASDLPPLTLQRDWQGYCRLLGKERQRYWQRQIENINPVLVAALQGEGHQRENHQGTGHHNTGQDTELVLCHNDLAFAHVAKGQPPMVIDWEYAAAGNRYFDIANCALVNQLTSSQIQQLTLAYAQESGRNFEHVHQQVNNHLPVAKLTYALWYEAIAPNI